MFKVKHCLDAWGWFGVSLAVFHKFGSPYSAFSTIDQNAYLWAFIVGMMAFLTYGLIDWKPGFEVGVVNFQYGENCLVDILGTKESILVTHFSKQPPKDAYISLLLSKLDAGIHLWRFLPPSLSDENRKWLLPFEQKLNYTQIITKCECMPFDIFIFDECKVYILFPTIGLNDAYTKGIVIENNEIAKMFVAALRRLNASC